jgi:hypothetical protein
VCLRDEVNDSIIWKWTPSGELSTVLAYSIQFQGSHPLFHTGKLWKAKTESKVKFFRWTAMHQKILTADILKIRGIQNNHFCPLCNVQAENATHLLTKCPFSLEVLRLIWSWFSLPGSPGPASSAHRTAAWFSCMVTKMGVGQARRGHTSILLVEHLEKKEGIYVSSSRCIFKWPLTSSRILTCTIWLSETSDHGRFLMD